MKSVAIKGFLGLNTIIPPEDFQLVQENFKTKGFYLKEALNVDIDSSLYLRRRAGTTRKITGSTRSLFSDGTTTLAKQSTNLVKINDGFSGVTVLRTGLISGLDMAYVSVNGRVYYSDGAVTGVVDEGASRSWGLDIPSRPVLTAGWGSLLSGTYMAVITYVRSDGQESGAGVGSSVTLSATGGVAIALPTTVPTGVTHCNIYVTRRDGEIFYHLGRYVAGATTAEYRRDGDITTARECRTQFLAPPLAGQVLGYYKGRIYVGDSDILWASGAYKYELFDLRHDYVGFDSEIVAFAAVDDGVYIGTERDIWFLGGNDFSTFKARQVINYGAIFGAVTYGDPGKVWMGTREGVCLLENGGEVKNVTRDHYHYDPGLTGAMLYHHSRGIPRVLVSLRGDAMQNYDAYKYGDEHTLTIADSTSSNTADNISTEV